MMLLLMSWAILNGITIYYEQETGTDQVDAGGVVTAITSNVLSGDFDITQKRAAQGQLLGAPDIQRRWRIYYED